MKLKKVHFFISSHKRIALSGTTTLHFSAQTGRTRTAPCALHPSSHHVENPSLRLPPDNCTRRYLAGMYQARSGGTRLTPLLHPHRWVLPVPIDMAPWCRFPPFQVLISLAFRPVVLSAQFVWRHTHHWAPVQIVWPSGQVNKTKWTKTRNYT